MSSVWDDPEIKAGGDFFKFEAIGDSIAGTITAVRVQRWDDGRVSPQLLLETDDGEEKTVTAGQVRLKTALAEQRPEAGDHVTITLTDIEKRSGGKTLKHFKVEVRRGGGAPAPRTAGPTEGEISHAEITAREDAERGGLSAEQQAAIAKLTPEQLAALGIKAS